MADYLPRKNSTRTLALVLVFLGLYVLMISVVPITDPTEGRYAQIARQMCESGDWVTPRVWIDGKLEPFLGKPPLFFWAAALTMKVVGTNQVAARLPNLVAMGLLLALLWVVAARYFDPTTARNAVLICLSCPVLLAASATVIVDIMLTVGVAGALLAYLAFSLEEERRLRKRWSLLVFACLGLGFMVKGPVAIVLFGLPVFAWTAWHKKWGDLRDHSWIFGGILFLLIVTPWFVVAERHNPGSCRYFFVNENFLRFVKHDYGDRYGRGHLHPRGMAILMMLGCTFPWCFYAGCRLLRYRASLGVRAMLRDDALCLSLFGFVAGTLFWSLSRQLLTAYLFPCVPMFALWLALAIRRQQLELRQKPTKLQWGPIALVACTFVAVFACLPLISRSSTRSILAKAEGLQWKGRLIAVHRTPYSAYFYAPNRVLAHPKEAADQSVARGNADDLFLIRHRYVSRLSADLQKRMQVLAETSRYRLFRMLPAGQKAAGGDGPGLRKYQ